ncbi:hypothetical protein [Halomarina rubra]|uniref:Uncharacterized protein n=1 Tax=Halomarina rubra TaxID=2071873 RepID=A0ABD6ASC4_9EURY|nr:hypothetical protein [Halomarina rubra]
MTTYRWPRDRRVLAPTCAPRHVGGSVDRATPLTARRRARG